MNPFRRLALIALLAGQPVAADARQEESPPPPPPASASTAAEAKPPPRFQGGVGGMIGIPVGEFHDNVEITGGITGHVGVGVGASPVSIGMEATYLTYGSEDRHLPVLGVPDLTVGVTTSNDIYLLHGRVRVQKLVGRVRGYVDGLVGFSYLTTTTKVDAEEHCSSIAGYYSCTDSGDSTTNLDDLVFSAGGGGGVMIGFGKSGAVRLDLSARYLYGGEATYLTEGGIAWGEGPPLLQPRRSRTDMLLVYIGVAIGR